MEVSVVCRAVVLRRRFVDLVLVSVIGSLVPGLIEMSVDEMVCGFEPTFNEGLHATSESASLGWDSLVAGAGSCAAAAEAAGMG